MMFASNVDEGRASIPNHIIGKTKALGKNEKDTASESERSGFRTDFTKPDSLIVVLFRDGVRRQVIFMGDEIIAPSSR